MPGAYYLSNSGTKVHPHFQGWIQPYLKSKSKAEAHQGQQWMPTIATFLLKQRKFSTKQYQSFEIVVFPSANSVLDIDFIILFCLNYQEVQN